METKALTERKGFRLYAHDRPVNVPDGWRFRCPDGHAQLRWSSPTTVLCLTCYKNDQYDGGPTYVVQDVVDQVAGGTLADIVARRGERSTPEEDRQAREETESSAVGEPPEEVVCERCGADVPRVTWGAGEAACYRCPDCRGGGTIAANGVKQGPVLTGKPELPSFIKGP